MLKIDTEMHPYRLKAGRKESLQLKVKITNESETEALASFEVLLSRMLSFDKSGFKNQEKRKLGKLEPGKSVQEYFEVHARPMIREGFYPIIIKATEHYNTYDFVTREMRKNLELRVDE